MSLPLKVVDRLFERLALTYGGEWSNKWKDVDPEAVKNLWSNELAQFIPKLEAIAWALENLPAKCPNAIEFKNLCRQAPAKPTPVLPAPKAPAEIVEKEMAAIASQAFVKVDGSDQGWDHRRWAKALKKRHESGEKLTALQVSMYQSALGITPELEQA